MKEVDYQWYLHLNASFRFLLLFDVCPERQPTSDERGGELFFTSQLVRTNMAVKHKTESIIGIFQWNLIIESFVLILAKISFQLQAWLGLAYTSSAFFKILILFNFLGGISPSWSNINFPVKVWSVCWTEPLFCECLQHERLQ